MCFSVPHYELMPISITDQPSEHENCISLFFFFSPSPFSVSLSLYCVSELGVIQDYSLAVSACRMVFDHNFYFPFLEKMTRKQQSHHQHRHIRKAAGPVKQAFIVSLYHYKIIEHLNE